MTTAPIRLADFGITKEWGYMQTTDPVVSLGAANADWDALARDLPKYLMARAFATA